MSSFYNDFADHAFIDKRQSFTLDVGSIGGLLDKTYGAEHDPVRMSFCKSPPQSMVIRQRIRGLKP